jgi:RNA polymerase sigma-70 factor (ECF subfamily)
MSTDNELPDREIAAFEVDDVLMAVRNIGEHEMLRTLLAEGARSDTAFAELYLRTHRAVYGVTLRTVRDPSQADEVVQEVYLEAWRKAAAYRADRASVAAWLLTIARRRAVDRVKSSQASRQRDHNHVMSDSHEPATAEDLFVQRDDTHRVRQALTKLTEPQRQAIVLNHIAGYSHREIAALTGVPIGTVKTRIRDGSRLLRNHLSESEGPQLPRTPHVADAKQGQPATD